MTARDRDPCPDREILLEMWDAVMHGTISRMDGARWAEQWWDVEEPQCAEWQREVLDLFSFAVTPAPDRVWLYWNVDFQDWREEYFGSRGGTYAQWTPE